MYIVLMWWTWYSDLRQVGDFLCVLWTICNFQIMQIRYIGIMKWRSTIPPISTKQTITSHLNSLNTKNTTIYDDENPYPGLGDSPTLHSRWLLFFKVMIISLWNLLQYHSIVRWAIQAQWAEPLVLFENEICYSLWSLYMYYEWGGPLLRFWREDNL
jgi:hypothetical protein